MGLFDRITCQYALPFPDLPEKGWQTKCLGCSLDSFILGEDGRLYQKQDCIELDDNDKGYKETEKTKLIDLNFEGAFSFYQSVDDVWHEFKAILIDGEVKKLIAKEPEKLPKRKICIPDGISGSEEQSPKPCDTSQS